MILSQLKIGDCPCLVIHPIYRIKTGFLRCILRRLTQSGIYRIRLRANTGRYHLPWQDFGDIHHYTSFFLHYIQASANCPYPQRTSAKVKCSITSGSGLRSVEEFPPATFGSVPLAALFLYFLSFALPFKRTRTPSFWQLLRQPYVHVPLFLLPAVSLPQLLASVFRASSPVLSA